MEIEYTDMKGLRAMLADRSRSAIYLDIAAGRLPRPIKLGGKNLFAVNEIRERLRELRNEAV